MRGGRAEVEAGARRFALTLGRALELALLAAHAQWEAERGEEDATRAAQRLALNGMDLLHRPLADAREDPERSSGRSPRNRLLHDLGTDRRVFCCPVGVK